MSLTTSFPEFFEQATGNPPFPYQTRLAEGVIPQLLDVPTGLGKTSAAILAFKRGKILRLGRSLFQYPWVNERWDIPINLFWGAIAGPLCWQPNHFHQDHPGKPAPLPVDL